MSTVYWVGNAAAAAQVNTHTISGGNGSSTFTVTIGGVSISVVWATSDNATASALQALLAASTHPYFSAITWTVGTNIITGTAKTAGVPFISTSAQSGGTGTFVAATTTASAGPNDWSTAANWSGGVVPTNGDDVVIRDSSNNILWGLGQSAIALNSLRIFKSFTGKLGLDWAVFATVSDGTTTTARKEYRSTYLQIGTSSLRIGENFSSATQTGSSRINIDLGSATACVVEVFGTAASSSESGRPAVKIIGTNANHFLYVRKATGGVGIAIDVPGETSTFNTVSVSDTTTDSKVFTGTGLTLTTWYQDGGVNICQAAGTITTITVNGGTLNYEGTTACTTVNVVSGTFYPNSSGTITTLNAKGGVTDATQSNRARTWTTFNLYAGATVNVDMSVVTIGTFAVNNTKPQSITAAS